MEMLAQLKIAAKSKAEAAKKAAQDVTKKGSEIIHLTTSNQKKEETTKEEDSLLDELNQQCNLTKRQRIYGALICYTLGAIFGLFSTMMLIGGGRHVRQFAFFYTVGNLCALGSSMFLVGPCRQVKVMCLPIRRVAASVWLTTMILTILVAIFLPHAGLMVLLLVCIQYTAALWYGASYVPYGRAMMKKCCKKAASTATSV